MQIFSSCISQEVNAQKTGYIHFVHLLNFLDQISSPCQCTEKLKKVLAFLVQLQKVNERDCDDIISEFSGLLGYYSCTCSWV